MKHSLLRRRYIVNFLSLERQNKSHIVIKSSFTKGGELKLRKVRLSTFILHQK